MGVQLQEVLLLLDTCNRAPTQFPHQSHALKWDLLGAFLLFVKPIEHIFDFFYTKVLLKDLLTSISVLNRYH